VIDKEKYLNSLKDAIESYNKEKFPWTKEAIISEFQILIEIIRYGYFDIKPDETKC